MSLSEERLNGVGLESIDIECYRISRVSITGITHSIADTLSYADPDAHIIDLQIKIKGDPTNELYDSIDRGEREDMSIDEDGYVEIGYINCSYIELRTPFLNNDSLFYICDSRFGDLEPMVEAILDTNTGSIKKYLVPDEYWFNTLLYIDRIYIKDKFRNAGIASFVLSNLANIIGYTQNLEEPDCQIVLPLPQVDRGDGLENATNEEQLTLKPKLINFYRKNFFKKIKGTNYMYLKKIE